MQNSTLRNSKLVRFLIVIGAVTLLLAPGLLMAIAWKAPLNLEVAVLATALAIAAGVWLRFAKWFFALIAALLIAVPPFPYWTNWDARKGQYLHFFHGFELSGELASRFAIVFLVAMLLFAAIFWALRERPKT